MKKKNWVVIKSVTFKMGDRFETGAWFRVEGPFTEKKAKSVSKELNESQYYRDNYRIAHATRLGE